MLNILKREWSINIIVNTSQKCQQTRPQKALVQRTTIQQVDGGATAKDGEVAGANLVAVVAVETTVKVAAVMEEKMSMISNKVDKINGQA